MSDRDFERGNGRPLDFERGNGRPLAARSVGFVLVRLDEAATCVLLGRASTTRFWQAEEDGNREGRVEAPPQPWSGHAPAGGGERQEQKVGAASRGGEPGKGWRAPGSNRKFERASGGGTEGVTGERRTIGDMRAGQGRAVTWGGGVGSRASRLTSRGVGVKCSGDVQEERSEG